jgi:hypothetical protein
VVAAVVAAVAVATVVEAAVADTDAVNGISAWAN